VENSTENHVPAVPAEDDAEGLTELVQPNPVQSARGTALSLPIKLTTIPNAFDWARDKH